MSCTVIRLFLFWLTWPHLRFSDPRKDARSSLFPAPWSFRVKHSWMGRKLTEEKASIVRLLPAWCSWLRFLLAVVLDSWSVSLGVFGSSSFLLLPCHWLVAALLQCLSDMLYKLQSGSLLTLFVLKKSHQAFCKIKMYKMSTIFVFCCIQGYNLQILEPIVKYITELLTPQLEHLSF